MKLRSLLFVPGDRPDRFSKAEASGADALILDLEDSVAFQNKGIARKAIADWLGSKPEVTVFVRINSLESGMASADLDAVLAARPDGIVMPKADGADSIRQLLSIAGGDLPPILPIASETPSAVFSLGTFRPVAERLAGLTWGAEDLPAAIGASTAREADGRLTPVYEVVRTLALLGAHAAGVPAIETVFPNIADLEGLAAYAQRGRRDGFSGMMAIHPSQVPVINAAFTPSDAEISHARAIVAAFAADPGTGALQIDGKMVDAPHLKQARRLLQSVDGI